MRSRDTKAYRDNSEVRLARAMADLPVRHRGRRRREWCCCANCRRLNPQPGRLAYPPPELPPGRIDPALELLAIAALKRCGVLTIDSQPILSKSLNESAA